MALLGVLLAAKPSFVLMPVLAGSLLLLLLLLLLAVTFSHLIPAIRPYPHHWLEPASTLAPTLGNL